MTESSYEARKRKRKLAQRRQRRRRIRAITLIAVFAGLIFFTAAHAAGETGGGEIVKILSSEVLIEHGYPESLAELYDRNPEAREFVLGYNNREDGAGDTDLTEEVKKGEIPLFIQWDERWGYEMYGSDFLAVTGCGPTSLSMVYCGLTGDTRWNPESLARLAEEKGYYVDGSGSSWTMMTELAEKIGLQAKNLTPDKSVIISELNGGHPVICIMGPGDFTDTGHYIVLTGVNKDGLIEIRDPSSKKNSAKAWELETIISQAKNLWSYSCIQ
ncbi:MAG: C39 family peptidase [Bacillota bacterium]|nr:C39 family peptidase [Bacillota bacterium]